MAKEAVTKAIKDAGVSYKDFEQAFVGYVYGRMIFNKRLSCETFFANYTHIRFSNSRLKH